MNENLKKACEGYELEEKIAKISTNDAKIFWETLEIITKIGKKNETVDKLRCLLENYKGQSDEDLLYDLISFNLSVEGEPDIITANFIDIGGFLVNVKLILSSGIGREYDFSKGLFRFFIVLNPDCPVNTILKDRKIYFSSQSVRDKSLKEIKKKLEGLGIRFL